MNCPHTNEKCPHGCYENECRFIPSIRIPRSSQLIMRAYRDGMRMAAQLVREYEIEHNKSYRERIAAYIEEKAK